MENKGQKILIVDDEADVCTVVKDALEYEGYATDVATTPNQALQFLDTMTYDLILIDIRLCGGMSGIDIIKHCRNIPKCPKIIVISATPKKALQPVFEQEGIAGLLLAIWEKPADVMPNKFIMKIKNVFEGKTGRF